MPSEKAYQKIAEWLDVYHSTDDIGRKTKVKTMIVAQMLPVVKRIAKTIARRANDPVDDLFQAGSIGLLKAIEHYDKVKNDNFRVYAGYLIIGEIKHYLRDKLNMIRVPAHIQELCIRINNFTKTLTYEEVQQLTTDEVAYALQLEPKTVEYALMMDRRKETMSLEDFRQFNSENLYYEEFMSDGDYKQKSEYEDVRLMFNEILPQLPLDERLLMDMYYKQDLTKKEIAEAMGITQMGVSRRMKKVFNKISEILEKKGVKQHYLDELAEGY